MVYVTRGMYRLFSFLVLFAFFGPNDANICTSFSCSPGEYPDFNTCSCLACPVGSYGDNGQRCLACPSSTVSGAATCTFPSADCTTFQDCLLPNSFYVQNPCIGFINCISGKCVPFYRADGGFGGQAFSDQPPVSFDDVIAQADCDGVVRKDTCSRRICKSNNTICPFPSAVPIGTTCINGCSVGRCDGINPECPSGLPLIRSGEECRASNGVCDTPEQCDGVSNACPSDTFANSSTQCRATYGDSICDPPEYCTGNSSSCPTDVIRNEMTPDFKCRESTGVCDPAESCVTSTNGVVCPDDLYSTSSIVCRAADGVCDTLEVCDGVNPQCPSDSVHNNETVCRSQTGGCDVEERCDGIQKTCPSDVIKTSGVLCESASDFCMLDSLCDGNSKTCPSNPFKNNSVPCRQSEGPCDIAEFCSGSSYSCPEDLIEDSSTICRPRRNSLDGSSCDLDEYCNGVDVTCPTDIVASAGTVCRTKQDQCDLADKCNGTSYVCPSTRKDYSYAYKCGNDFYFCTASQGDVSLRNQKTVIFAGQVIGGVVSTSVLYNLSAVVPYPGCTLSCPSRKCPNGKDMSFFVDAVCSNTSGLYIANQKISFSAPFTTSPVCPYWVSTLSQQSLPVEPFGSSASSISFQFTLYLLAICSIYYYI